MIRDPLIYLGHILDSATAIAEYISGVKKAEFMHDPKLRDAVIRRLEIIGEATKRITEEIKERDKSIPWKQMAGLRDILIHDYAFVDPETVWTVAKHDVPKLAKRIAVLLK
jgi:uncharacterized protein with HEPN domain